MRRVLVLKRLQSSRGSRGHWCLSPVTCTSWRSSWRNATDTVRLCCLLRQKNGSTSALRNGGLGVCGDVCLQTNHHRTKSQTLTRHAANDALQQAWVATCEQQKQQRVEAARALEAAQVAYEEAMTQQQADRARLDIAAAQHAVAQADALQVFCAYDCGFVPDVACMGRVFAHHVAAGAHVTITPTTRVHSPPHPPSCCQHTIPMKPCT